MNCVYKFSTCKVTLLQSLSLGFILKISQTSASVYAPSLLFSTSFFVPLPLIKLMNDFAVLHRCSSPRACSQELQVKHSADHQHQHLMKISAALSSIRFSGSSSLYHFMSNYICFHKILSSNGTSMIFRQRWRF